MKLNTFIQVFLIIFIIVATPWTILNSNLPTENNAQAPIQAQAKEYPGLYYTTTATIWVPVSTYTTTETLKPVWKVVSGYLTKEVSTRYVPTYIVETYGQTIWVPIVVYVGTGTESPILRTMVVPRVIQRTTSIRTSIEEYDTFVRYRESIRSVTFEDITTYETKSYVSTVITTSLLNGWKIGEYGEAITPTQDRRSCLYAFAAYGSALAPEVVFLRSFRNNFVMKTFVGGQFMTVFNSWYYSFSSVAVRFISQHPSLRAVVRGALYPLTGVAHLSFLAYSSLDFNPELAVAFALFLAFSLTGAIYLTPLMLIGSYPLGTLRNCRRYGRKALSYSAYVIPIGWGLAFLGMVLQFPPIVKVGSVVAAAVAVVEGGFIGTWLLWKIGSKLNTFLIHRL